MKIIPRDYQQELMDKVRLAFRAGLRSPLVVAATGAGKCLAPGTPVLMYDGSIKLVEDIVVGDYVMGPDRKPRRIETLASGIEAMYQVTPSNGEPYVVNASHVLSLRNERGIVKNLTVIEYLAEPFYWRILNRGWRVPGLLLGDLTPELVEITVEPVGEGRYYGFELSGPDRLFVLGDFTVTHNTVVFSAIADSAAARGNEVLILAHRDTLIKQASGKLSDNGVKHGIIMAGFTQALHHKVQVGSVQTVARRLAKIRWKPKLIIIDEAHLSAAKTYRDILAAFPDALVLGFTGSPCRLDNKPLGKASGGIYDDLIQAISIKQLIARGFLVQPTVFGAAEALDLSGIKKSMGDYATAELAAVVDKPKITGDAVQQYMKICPDVPAVAWCITVEHAQHVADAFNASGIAAVMLCGEHDGAYRDKVLRQLETGEVKVVTFVGILIEGVDQPAIGAIILLRPTMSLASYLQVIGRGLRPYTNPHTGIKKECCFVLDHAGLWQRHGFADEERDWELNGEVKKPGKKKDKEPSVDLIQCRGCFAVFSPEQAAEAGQKVDLGGSPRGPCCPNCGKAIEVKTRKLEHVDGELTQITPEMVAERQKEARREQGSAQSLDDLKAYGAKMGRSPKWAEHVFNARQRKKPAARKAPPAIELPPVPTEIELSIMTMPELEKVCKEQGWPMRVASDLFHKFNQPSAQ